MKFFSDFDYAFLILVFFIIALGLITLYSVSEDGSLEAFHRQILWVVIGTGVLFFSSRIPFRFWQSIAPFLYIISIVLLILVLFLSKGVKRWIEFGPISFQPSEFAKVATVLFMSDVLSIRRYELKSLRSFLVPLFICLVPFVLVLVEPDMGTSMIFLIIFFALIFYKGAKPVYLFIWASPVISLVSAFHWGVWVGWLVILFLVIYFSRIPLNEAIIVFVMNIIIGLLNPLVWQALLPYQKARITSFLSPETNPAGVGWQILQSKIAIGSGGIFGKGFLGGSQKGFAFLPQKQTDFAFSSFAEEFGFIGVAILFISMIGIVIRGFNIARTSRNQFASLFAFGLVSLIISQVIINVGMTMGIFPVVGIPFPLLSYGGSSMIVFMGIVGTMLSLGRQRYKY